MNDNNKFPNFPTIQLFSMEPEKAAATFSSSAASNMRAKNTTTIAANNDQTIAHCNADAGLLNEFEQSTVSGKSFNYTTSTINAPQSVPEERITAYFSRIQRGALVQSFGCMLAVDEATFKVICYSENCFELLGLNDTSSELKEVNTLIGVDARALFIPSSGESLARASAARELSLLNPVWVYSRTTQKPFYAILHRIDVGIVIDLEPAKSGDPALSLAGAVQSQKLAVRAISKLQSLPGGDIGALCDTMVENVQKLTGYDRVMVYKFHEDEHGEVVSEIRREDLESYLGLHYPATDIPQAARFLFKQNRVRIICDCNAEPVNLVQSEELKQPLLLVNSTLRSPHGCHRQYMANMGSIASLVMAVTVNNTTESTKLWGLVVCHHTTPRYVPFPLRYACEFLIQAFGLQLNMELQLAAQLAEKKNLKTQTLLCDMLLRDAPSGIVTQSPSIMDIVKCDGAALYYSGTCWLMGVTPTEAQVKSIVEWLLKNHGDSTGLSTDSLAEAGYPAAAALGNAVCGLATARISSNDFLFWFRSHTAKEVLWGGAKHDPDEKDDGERMHPRSSFKAFLEVAKSRSLPWDVSEINAIHSLQLIMRDSFQDMEETGLKAINHARPSGSTMKQSQGMDELKSVACEMVKLIETAQVPIFGVDSEGIINGWNAKMAELTGLQDSEAMGKSLVNDIVHEDSHGTVEGILSRALQGDEDKNIQLKLRNFGPQQNSQTYIVANSCTSRNRANNVVGVCFVGQDITCEKLVTDKFIRLQGDYKAIIQSLNPLIPPIFASDENACCSEWNAAMEKLTGVTRDEAIGKVLPGEIFGDYCRLKGEDSMTKFMIALYQGISGQEIEKFPFGFFDREGKYVEVLLTASKRTDADENIIGCFCFLQISQPDLQSAMEGLLRQEDDNCPSKIKELIYMRQEMKNPLNGIRFTHKLLENTIISSYQKQFLDTSDACERQIMAILENMDTRSIEQGVVLNMEEFLLGSLLDVIVSQAMISLRQRNVQLFHEIPNEIKSLYLHGDQIKLQLVLSDFLLNVVHHASPDSWVEIRISPGLKLIKDGNSYIRLQFRMTLPGQGLPTALIEDTFDDGIRWTTQEGLGLNMSRKLLCRMNGRVQYVREHDKCYFLIDIELRTRKERQMLLLTQADKSASP
uniref:phytochrome E-like isoform X2 n=1 Tax=Fragaria vesca subsp. vesca TaxID=101020 RepID=UPI0005C9127E|nr:PREDICTED: phytochrome E-like isoform X2 [Fragaria vesca subsp. vesca]